MGIKYSGKTRAAFGETTMNKIKAYILNELQVIEKECMEKGISASQWVERYAEDFHKRYWNARVQRVHSGTYQKDKRG